MIKKIIYGLICSLVICAVLTSCNLAGVKPNEPAEAGETAASVTDPPKKVFESVTYEIEDGCAVITGCVKNTSGKLSIPESIENCPVTAICDYAFADNTGITGVAIPDTVKRIGEGAFYNCTGLSKTDIPDTVESIGHNAFFNTAYYNYKSSWDGEVLYVGNHLIYAKRKIEGDYTIREGTKCIADNAFYDTEGDGCAELTGITIPEGVTCIGNSAFEYCDKLTEIIIPEGVKKIGVSAFRECTGIKNISLPDSITEIGENAFIYTDYYNDPSNWDEGVLYIGNHLIKAEDGITGVCEIRPGTVCIAANAFSYCGEITGAVIPESVGFIGSGAFLGCDSLADVFFDGDSGLWESVDIGPDNGALTAASIRYAAAEDEETSGSEVTDSYDLPQDDS